MEKMIPLIHIADEGFTGNNLTLGHDSASGEMALKKGGRVKITITPWDSADDESSGHEYVIHFLPKYRVKSVYFGFLDGYREAMLVRERKRAPLGSSNRRQDFVLYVPESMQGTILSSALKFR